MYLTINLFYCAKEKEGNICLFFLASLSEIEMASEAKINPRATQTSFLPYSQYLD